MIERLPKPLKFDKDQSWMIVAKDGEKFYVAPESELALNPNRELTDLKAKNLLEWAMLSNYPLGKFVRLQKVLSARFYGI